MFLRGLKRRGVKAAGSMYEVRSLDILDLGMRSTI